MFDAQNFLTGSDLFDARTLMAELSTCPNVDCPNDQAIDFDYCSEDCLIEVEGI